MEDLPEPLLAEITKRITRTGDLNSLSLVSKQLYTIEAGCRDSIRVGLDLHPATESLASLCSRFPNLRKVEINYSGWTSSHGKQLDNQGLHVLSSSWPLLTDLTLSFCSYIDDSGLGYLAHCKELKSLRLNFAPAISSSGLLSVAVGCKGLSVLQLVSCMKVGSVEWLEYLGRAGSLQELVVKDCKGINQYGLLRFGPGWMKLQKFEYKISGEHMLRCAHAPTCVALCPSRYGIFCENLKDLRLANIFSQTGTGLLFLLRKCRALERLCLEFVVGLNESEMIALFQNCSNLKSVSLWLLPLTLLHNGIHHRTPFTDDSLKALSLSCPMLQVLELTLAYSVPSKIGVTQKGVVNLIQSCPIRVLALKGAYIFNDEGMEALSSMQFLETLELVDCQGITDAGMGFIAHSPCLSNLTLSRCRHVTDDGMTELAYSQKLESLTIADCPGISWEGAQGAAKSVCYSAEPKRRIILKGL